MADSIDYFDSIALGAGVQSFAMYAMACEGELTPLPKVAIFSDTGCEPPHVYKQIAWLVTRYGKTIPIRVVQQGNLLNDLLHKEQGRYASIPAFQRSSKGRGMSRRQCTYEYKIRPMLRALREEAGLKPGARCPDDFRVRHWKGISLDEAHRMKVADEKWLVHRYPLVMERPMRRGEIERWLRLNGFPEVRKSACSFCPFRSNAGWREIRDDYPELWEQAVDLDAALRDGRAVATSTLRQASYLHGDLVPLAEADIDIDPNQADLFGNECEGECGV